MRTPRTRTILVMLGCLVAVMLAARLTGRDLDLRERALDASGVTVFAGQQSEDDGPAEGEPSVASAERADELAEPSEGTQFEAVPAEPAQTVVTAGEGASTSTEEVPPYDPSVVLLDFAPGTTVEQANAALAQVGALAAHEVTAEDIAHGYVALQVAEGSTVEQAVEALSAHDEVLAAQPDFIYYPLRGDETALRVELGAFSAREVALPEELGQGHTAGELVAMEDGSDPAEAFGAVGPQSEDVQVDGSRQDDSPVEETQSHESQVADAQSRDSIADGSRPEQRATDLQTEPPLSEADSADDDTSDPVTDADYTLDSTELLAALAATVNDPRAADQWALSSMKIYDAWAEATCDGSVGIAIMDEGPDATHEDLAANVILAYDAYADSDTYDFAVQHGTHVAGIASAVADNGLGVAGVSHNAGIALINVFYQSTNSSGVTSNVTNTSTLRRAYQYLADHQETLGVRVVNLSLGVKKDSRSTYQDDALVKCIDEAFANGIVTVAAAGNSDLGSVPYYEYPGDAPNVVSVINLRQGTTGIIKNGTSNYNKDGQTDKNISAPGTSIISTGPSDDTNPQGTYLTLSGTSMAAPHVAGVLALEFAANPALTSQEAVEILYATAHDLGDEGWDTIYGWGEVDAHAAVVAARTGEYPSLPDISGEVMPEPQVTGPTRVPVGATAAFQVSDGTIELQDTGVATLKGSMFTGVKAGVATLVVRDANGDVYATRNVAVYDTSGCWTLHSALNDAYVLDVKGGSVLNSGNVHLYTKTGKYNQVWLLEAQEDGTFMVRSGKSGKVLDVAGASTRDGANVIQYKPGTKAWQRWRMEVAADNSVRLVNAHSGMALAVAGGVAGNSRNVCQAASADQKAQLWNLRSVSADIGPIWDGVYKVATSINKTYVLDVKRASTGNGANVQLYKANDNDNQKWRFEYLGKGVYRISNVHSGKVLDVARGTLKNSVNIDQWSWNGGSNQRWQLVKYTDGSYAILRAGTSWAVDVKGAAAANGRNVHQYQRKNNAAQRWVLTQY